MSLDNLTEPIEPSPELIDAIGELIDAGAFDNGAVPPHSISAGDEEYILLAKPGFAIDSESAAEWFVNKINSLKAEKIRILANAQDIVKHLDSQIEQLRSRFEPQLAHWAKAELEARGEKGKTLRLLSGKVSFVTVRAGVAVVDKEAALEFAAEHELNTCVRHVPERFELEVAEYKRVALAELESTGDILPGVEPTPAEERMYIK